MKKILITVGTTPFNELIEFCDKNIDTSLFEIKAQISPYASYIPENFEHFDYIDNFESVYLESDLIISHAGAGSVYKLLELKKNVIFVPNHTMKDGHQDDICRFIEDNLYANIFRLNTSKTEINELILNTIDETFNIYLNDFNNSLVQTIYKLINS